MALLGQLHGEQCGEGKRQVTGHQHKCSGQAGKAGTRR